MPAMLPILNSAACIKKYENNPVLSSKDVPYASDLVFNAGIVKRNGKYQMLFRNENKLNESGTAFLTVLGVAESDDGKNWTVRKDIFSAAEKTKTKENKRIYDPRLTEIDGELYICFAMDTNHGIRGGIGKIIGDFEDLEIISLSVPDNRNMVLFPEKINGMYVRLERPFPVYSRGCDRFDIWISKSPDLKFWGESELLAGVEDFPFANDKIGPAAPPVKTPQGWLVVTHAVDIDRTRGKNGWDDKWQKRYCAGLMLLDLENPYKILGIYKKPLIAPETPCEVDEGYRTNVIFPCGCIKEEDNTLKIYYGASDTVTCLAEADIDELINLCLEG